MNLRRNPEREKRKSEGKDSFRPAQIALDEYEFRSSEGDEKHHHTSGETFPMDELEMAERQFATSPGFEKIPSAHKALLLRNLGIFGPSEKNLQSSEPTVASQQPEFVRKEKMKKAIRTKVGRLVYLCRSNGIKLSGDNPYQAINNAWGRIEKYSHESTNDELERKLNWLESLISRVLKGDKTVVSELR